MGFFVCSFFVFVRKFLCPFSQTKAKLYWKTFVVNYKYYVKRKLKSHYLSWFPSNFWESQHISQGKLMLLWSLCFESGEQKKQHFKRKTYAFNFDLFVFLRMENRIEESRSHAVYFPNDVTKSAKALVSLVCMNSFEKHL